MNTDINKTATSAHSARCPAPCSRSPLLERTLAGSRCIWQQTATIAAKLVWQGSSCALKSALLRKEGMGGGTGGMHDLKLAEESAQEGQGAQPGGVQEERLRGSEVTGRVEMCGGASQ